MIQNLAGGPAKPLTSFNDWRKILDYLWSHDGKQPAILRQKETTDILRFKKRSAKPARVGGPGKR
jgi:hypothetical protein